ncbi:MAG: SET domain-containing protein-lysine N-methyltransferase [Acidobacteria bacterium]|nr:SET domain-containing protein-lysine N-methyltransferase [Acidobacteriota bacterium]
MVRMPRENRLPRVARRRSSLHGWGVFALEPVTKNTRIIDYAGELIDHKESLTRETRYLARGEIWCFTVNRRWVRDANVGGNVARFINHSCRPNCYSHIVGRTIWIRASRSIQPGEELTYDYYTDGECVIPCRCRSGCPRRL